MHNFVLFPIVLSASTFLSYSALAACTSNPDCATLGYTKTSCASGDLIMKCPFDTSKVQCIPQTCETIGKKTCGDNCITGNCCSNADCASGKICDNNACKDLCGKNPYAVGDIYCNAGGTPIGVVGKISNGGKNGIVVEKNHSSSTMPWGCYGTDLSCIANIPKSDDGSNPELRADYNGKANTACIASNCGSGTAGYYCKNRSVEGVSNWYLPAGGELYDTMIANRTTINTGLSKISGSQAIPLADTYIQYWSSSEYDNIFSSDDDEHAWGWSFNYANWKAYIKYYHNQDGYNHVRCVLAF